MVRKGLHAVAGYVVHGSPARFDDGKKELIDFVCMHLPPGPIIFAELDRYPARRGVLVDTNMTDSSIMGLCL